MSTAHKHSIEKRNFCLGKSRGCRKFLETFGITVYNSSRVLSCSYAHQNKYIYNNFQSHTNGPGRTEAQLSIFCGFSSFLLLLRASWLCFRFVSDFWVGLLTCTRHGATAADFAFFTISSCRCNSRESGKTEEIGRFEDERFRSRRGF